MIIRFITTPIILRLSMRCSGRFHLLGAVAAEHLPYPSVRLPRCASDVLGNSSQRVFRKGICHRSGCQGPFETLMPLTPSRYFFQKAFGTAVRRSLKLLDEPGAPELFHNVWIRKQVCLRMSQAGVDAPVPRAALYLRGILYRFLCTVKRV
jgi:hypothetical protein